MMKKKRSTFLSIVFVLFLVAALIPAPLVAHGVPSETAPDKFYLPHYGLNTGDQSIELDPAITEDSHVIPEGSQTTYFSAHVPTGVTMSVIRNGVEEATTFDSSVGYWYSKQNHLTGQPDTYVVTFSKEGAESTVYTFTVSGGTPPPADDTSVYSIQLYGNDGSPNSLWEEVEWAPDGVSTHTFTLTSEINSAKLIVPLPSWVTVAGAELNGEVVSPTIQYQNQAYFWEGPPTSTFPSTYEFTTLARDGVTKKTYTITVEKPGTQGKEAQVYVRLWDEATNDDIAPGLSYVTYDYNVGDTVFLSDIAKDIPGYQLVAGQDESYLIEQVDWKITLLYEKLFRVVERPMAIDNIKDQLPKEFLKKYPKVVVRDIFLADLQGNPLDGTDANVPTQVEVTVNLSDSDLDLSRLEIFHLKDGGTLETIKNFSVNKETKEVTFMATDFSPFLFANAAPAVEPTPPATTTDPAGTVTKVTTVDKTPKTGDEGLAGLAALLMVMGAAGCTLLIKRKRENI